VSDLKLIRRPGSDVWHVVGTLKIPDRSRGVLVRQSSGTSRLEEAKVFRDRLRKEVLDRETLGTAHSLTFADCVLVYLEKGGEKRFLRPILERFGPLRVKDIRADDVSRFALDVYGHKAPATIKRELYTPLNAALRAGCVEHDAPVRRFTPPKVERKSVQEAPPDWFPEFFAAAHFRIALVVLFLTTTGARVTEGCRLKVRDCNLETGKALLRTTKTGKPRVVALTDVLCRAISSLVEAEKLGPDDLVFGYAARWSVNQAIERVCAKAGITYYSSHKLGRHAFAARWLASGKSLRGLQEAGQWASIQVVAETYGHLEESAVYDAIREVGSEVGEGAIDTPQAHIPHRQRRRMLTIGKKTAENGGLRVVGTRGIEPLTPTMSREGASALSPHNAIENARKIGKESDGTRQEPDKTE